MTTFDEIYGNTVKYRNSFAKIISATNKIASYKESDSELVAYLRRKNWIIRTQIEPVILATRSKINIVNQNDDDNNMSKNELAEDKIKAKLRILKANVDQKRQEMKDLYDPEIKSKKITISELEEKIKDEKLLISLFDDQDSVEIFNNEWEKFAKKYGNFVGNSTGKLGHKNSQTYSFLQEDLEKNNKEFRDENNAIISLTKKYTAEKNKITEKFRENKKKLAKKKVAISVKKTDKNNIEILHKLEQNSIKLVTELENIKNKKDLEDHQGTINGIIGDINANIRKADVDLNEILEVPIVNKNAITSEYDPLREEIAKVKGYEPRQHKFDGAIKVLNTLGNDISHNRGVKAFNNRSGELLELVNDRLNWFNTTYWQITGRRWEKQGKEYGYSKVTPTNQPISLI